MKYDDASWHYGAEDLGKLPDINGYTHTGTFVAWAMLNGLAGEFLLSECSEEIEKLKARKITPAEFFRDNCDGKFTDDDLSETGNGFAQSFFDESYYEIYAEAVDPGRKFGSIYEVPSNWETYDKVATELMCAFEVWKHQNL